MAVAVQEQVGPDLVRNNPDVMLFENLHGAEDLLLFPDPSAGVVRVAEDRGVDMVLPDLLFHILVIQAPDAVRIALQGVQDDPVAVVFQRMGETNIGRALQENRITAGAEHVQR